MNKIVALRPVGFTVIESRRGGESVAPPASPSLKVVARVASTTGLLEATAMSATPSQLTTRGPITTKVRRIGFTGFPSDIEVENRVYDVIAARALISQAHIEWAVKKLQEEIDRRKWQAELDAMLSEDEVA